MIPRYIANGTYGCVLKPIIACNKNNEVETVNSITKIFDNNKEQSDEVKINKAIIKKIDPQNYFTVELKADCDIDINKYPSDQIKKCSNFKTAKKFSQIIYEDGGVSLDTYMRNPQNPAIELKHFERLFKGLVELDRTKGIHLDIKPDNIVYNTDTNKLCLIDFGLYTKATQLYSKNMFHVHAHPYYFYPPEFSIYYHRSLVLDNYETIMGQDRINKCSKLLNIYDFLYNTNYNDNMDILYTKLKSMTDFKDVDSTTGPLRKYYNKYTNKVDVYMLGISLLSYLSYKTPNNNDNPILCKKIGELICNMLNLNVEERYTPKQAYDAFVSIISNSSIKKHTSLIRIRSVDIVKPSPVTKGKADCPPGKIRHPETKRCRKIVIKKEPKSCPPGKERNPETGRCRKIRT